MKLNNSVIDNSTEQTEVHDFTLTENLWNSNPTTFCHTPVPNTFIPEWIRGSELIFKMQNHRESFIFNSSGFW